MQLVLHCLKSCYEIFTLLCFVVVAHLPAFLFGAWEGTVCSWGFVVLGVWSIRKWVWSRMSKVGYLLRVEVVKEEEGWKPGSEGVGVLAPDLSAHEEGLGGKSLAIALLSSILMCHQMWEMRTPALCKAGIQENCSEVLIGLKFLVEMREINLKCAEEGID